jgi:peptidoglycan hydrolase CwlO-like protein
MKINDKLDLILKGIKELQQITRAIYDRQEETDAKLEALASDVHKLHGEITAIRQER